IRFGAALGGNEPGRSFFRDLIGLRSARRLIARPLVRDGTDELANARLNFRAPARAVEHAVMADALLHVVDAMILRNAPTEIVRSFRLAKPADVVALALDRHQRRFLDGRAIDVFMP